MDGDTKYNGAQFKSPWREINDIYLMPTTTPYKQLLSIEFLKAENDNILSNNLSTLNLN